LRVALIDTVPVDARNLGSVNLGLKIAARKLGADTYHWRDSIPHGYDTLAYNVFYPMHILNMLVSIKANHRGEKVIAGGQGVSNINGLLTGIVDEIYKGEIDGDAQDGHGWNRQDCLDSPPEFSGNKAVIELTRGCKYRCTFCEYGSVTGGKYREKDIGLVKEQIDTCVGQGIRHINFLSANLSGYRMLDELMEYCSYRFIRILNSDMCLTDIDKIMPWLDRFKMRNIKLGLESFDEQTRHSVKKNITDSRLDSIIDELLITCNYLHFYLIYGLPQDNYDSWYSWLDRLAEKRLYYTAKTPHMFDGVVNVNTKNVRFEFSITNFEPVPGTPLQYAPEIDFVDKAMFLQGWFSKLKDTAFYQPWAEPDYKNTGGRIGRRENSYKMLMSLKTGRVPNLQAASHKVFPRGVGRSIDDDKALRWLSY